MTRGRRVRRWAAAVLAVTAAFAGGWLTNAAAGPDCPTEDSCQVDYRDGGWHVTEVTP